VVKDKVIRDIIKGFKNKELLRIGNRSYVNSFRYPESRFDKNDPVGYVLRDPSKVFTEYAIIPPSYLIFKYANMYYSKCGLPQRAGMIEMGKEADEVVQPAINALSPEGGTIFIKAGKYKTTKTIQIHLADGNDKVRLIGEGSGTGQDVTRWGAPTILYSDIAMDLISVKGIAKTPPENCIVGCSVENMYLRGNSKGTTYSGIRLQYTDLCWLRNLSIENCGRAISFLNNLMGWADFLTLTSNTYGIYADDNSAWYVYQGDISTAEEAGVYLKGIIDWTFDGIDMTNSPKYHFYIESAWRARIISCKLTGADVYAIHSLAGDYLVLAFLDIYKTVWYQHERGINIAAGRGVNILYCTIRDATSHGIFLQCPDAKIIGNHIFDNGGDGIRLTSYDVNIAKNCVVAKNTVKNNAGYGISCVGVSERNIIEDNILEGNTLGNIYDVGIENRIKRNLGYPTENSGEAVFSGNGTTTSFSWTHGLVETPTKILVTPKSADASGNFYVTADATNITIIYITAPPTGTNNIVLSWYAEV